MRFGTGERHAGSRLENRIACFVNVQARQHLIRFTVQAILKSEDRQRGDSRIMLGFEKIDAIPVLTVPLYSVSQMYDRKSSRRKSKAWSMSEAGPFSRVELAALEFFKKQGFSGVHDEGFFMNQTMRAAMLYDMNSRKEFMSFGSGFSDPRNDYAQGLLSCAKDSSGRFSHICLTGQELVNKIRGAPKDAVKEFLIKDSEKPRFHASPKWGQDKLSKYLEFLDVISFEILADIAELQVQTGAYAGFPDLTLWRDRELTLVEVKSPNDRLTSNQIGAFCNVLLSAKINLFIASVRDA